MASHRLRAIPLTLASITAYQQFPGIFLGKRRRSLPKPNGWDGSQAYAAFCEAKQNRWLEERVAVTNMPPREGSEAWSSEMRHADAAGNMTLSAFLRLLEDVDAERAAKGSAGLMRIKPQPLPEAQDRSSVAAEDVKLLLRYAEVAVSSYGPGLLNPLFFPEKHSASPPAPADINGWRMVVQSHLPIHVKLLYAEPSCTWLRPAYFVAVDLERNCVILSIRGTLSPEDIMTDLSAEEAETPWGPAHKGMLLSAQVLLLEACPHLERALDDFGFDKLVVVGHSLGGGVATYAVLLLEAARAAEGPEVSVSCYAYGAPGLARADTAATPGSGSVSITTVVNGYDWISRLSYGHVVDLLHRGHKEFESMMGVVKSFLGNESEKAEKRPAMPHKPLPDKLYPCGNIVLLLAGQAVRGSRADLEDLQLHPSMFMAHLPSSYEEQLRAALDKNGAM